jgi:hypothetical protein
MFLDDLHLKRHVSESKISIMKSKIYFIRCRKLQCQLFKIIKIFLNDKIYTFL